MSTWCPFSTFIFVVLSLAGGDGKNPKDGKDGKKPSGPQPPSATAKRILVLAQKGDWPACEQALKTLERAKGEGGDKKPLENVSDSVSIVNNIKNDKK